jgi:hypothetical protein
MIYEKQKALTPHTYVQGNTHIDVLHQVDLITRLRLRILIITDEFMSQCWNHISHDVGGMPHSNESLWMKILIWSGFMR